MYSYIRVKTEELDSIENLLIDNGVEYRSEKESLYFSVEDRLHQIIENNIVTNNTEDIDNLMDFVYSDFNPLDIDNQIMEKILIYQSGKEEN